MYIIFEEHQYKAADVKDALKDISSLQDVDKRISVSYVGYFYNAHVRDCVFILPKVLLQDQKVTMDDGTEKTIEVVANVHKNKQPSSIDCVVPCADVVTPEDIITPEGQEKHLTKEYRKFIYEFAVWIYRALSVYRKQNPSSRAIYFRQLPQEGRGRRHKADTYLDVILSLIRFNRENQNFFLFTIKNIHSGHNKINWTKTISRSEAILQGHEVVYLDPVNKKRKIDFEEELFIIFFSILNYLNEQYGFKTPVNCQYDLITGAQFKSYLKGRGKIRLRQIRYKYFSDKLLQLWDLCTAFFDAAHKIAVNTSQKEYLLAKSFEHVFEAMIDELIGEKNIPSGLKEQLDGKRVDHMYTYYGLIHDNEKDEEIYYIGDSKYYKTGHALGRESVYKQYTYARNVVQWNIDLFMKGEREGWTDEEKEAYRHDKEKYGKIRLRNDEQDPLTEGYNVIPNFFISAFVDKERRYVADKNIQGHPFKKNNVIVKDENGEIVPQTYTSFQFEDRLFDRDTLILSHYDVNFLYVIYLYARNKKNEKTAWKREVRKLFRERIRKVLQEKYDFYALKSKGNPIAGEEFIKEHFKELQGKLYRPYGDPNLFALALEKHVGSDTNKSETYLMLDEFFEITSVNLGDNPKETLEHQVEQFQQAHQYQPVPDSMLPYYHVERYLSEYFVVGMYHDQEHWDWITGKNDRGTLIYNVRLGDRPGALPESRIRKMKPKFAILYEEHHEGENKYHVFRIHDMAKMSKERMIQALYKDPKGDFYLIFRFDDEVKIGRFDINAIIKHFNKEAPYGSPIYLTGEQLLKFKI
ncbi:MAG: restriction endonuclease [Muribaculaceae bacterium]|nr:restriction endonuclease [Muribaculaceae bacterium]